MANITVFIGKYAQNIFIHAHCKPYMAPHHANCRVVVFGQFANMEERMT